MPGSTEKAIPSSSTTVLPAAIAGASFQIAIIIGVTSVAIVSVVRGLDGGVKVLSNINMTLALILLAFMILVGHGLAIFSGLLPRLFKGPMLFLLLLLAAVVILGWLSEQARRFPRFRVYGEAVRCLGRPAWLAASERLTSEVVSDISRCILS